MVPPLRGDVFRASQGKPEILEENAMKNMGASLFAGILAAFGGLLVSELAGSFFNGMEYGSAIHEGAHRQSDL